jgi:hypothetical protein
MSMLMGGHLEDGESVNFLVWMANNIPHRGQGKAVNETEVLLTLPRNLVAHEDLGVQQIIITGLDLGISLDSPTCQI